VASKKPNAFGLYDMSGNVFEWINDWYAEYGSDPVKDPIGSATESYHFVRGGSWGNGVEYLRSANRTFASPDYYIYFCGFRTVLPLNTTSVGTRSWDNSNTVQDFHLDQNYPNPFNPSTTIRFQVPSTSVVTLAVYNSKGDEVSLLLDHQTLAAGRHTIDYEPSHLSAGVYFYRLITGERVLVKKMVLLQ
jgi:hypothetical protein